VFMLVVRHLIVRLLFVVFDFEAVVCWCVVWCFSIHLVGVSLFCVDLLLIYV